MSTTVIFIILGVIAVAAYDVWVIAKQGKFESISAYVIRTSKKAPLIVLLIGIVLGHLFWSMDTFDYLSREDLIKRCNEYRD